VNLIEKSWYGARPLWPLLPLSWLFRVIAAFRRWAYRSGLKKRVRLPVPVIIVGNISVGGTGKTPFVIWLVERLQQAGYRPGIITRGYGGQARTWPQAVTAISDPVQVGDEPVLLAQRCQCPIVAGPDRVLDAQQLLAQGCNVIISDDGLQHYRLQRDIEIVVIDGERRLGNGHCLPAGPLREPASRLQDVDFVIANGRVQSEEVLMTLIQGQAYALQGQGSACNLQNFNKGQVHAVAGIGHPGRFFAQLRNRGLQVIEHPFPDHYPYKSVDLQFNDDLPVLMTEKDAVKYRPYATHAHWYVPVVAQLPAEFEHRLLTKLRSAHGQ
jgi:tetraacyldisaccharide 4'-kinase